MSRAQRDRLRSAQLVTAVTEPAGIVVVGASADPQKSSGRSLDYLRRFGFAGSVWVVNPRHESIAGYPCVASIEEVPAGQIDAAIVNLPAGAVTGALRDLDQAGVRSAVVIGSGFEHRDSAARQDLLAFLASASRSLRVIGPNCVGTMSVSSGAHLNFSSVLQSTALRAGGAALVTQSGATGNGILMSLLRRGAGLSHWFSTGDELDVGALEVMAGLLPRPEVTCVGLFIEGITDIEWLPEVRHAMAEHGKQVFVVKIADSDLGQVAAGGHTGRVVGSSDISRAVLAQAGFVRLESVAELTDCLVASEIIGRLPRSPAVVGVSVSGASGVILADQVRATPTLSMPPLDDGVAAQLRARVAGRIPISNPLDVPFLGETRTFADLVAMASVSAAADVVLAVESSLVHDRAVLTEILCQRPAHAAPIVLTHLSEDDIIDAGHIIALADARVAVVPTPERAVQAVGHIVRGDSLAPHLVTRSGAGLACGRPGQPGRLMGLDGVAALLPAGFPWARWITVTDAGQARAAAARFGLPVAIKAAGATIAHRAELGAVELVRDGADVAGVYERIARICAQHGDDVVVQEGVPPGQEILLAIIADPEYGLAAVLRPGGVLTELLDEQVVLWHGWAAADRMRTLDDSRIGTLLSGYRGQQRSSLAPLHDLVETALGSLAGSGAGFVEFNPVVMLPGEVRVLDAIGTIPENGDHS
jgi:acyl-CoA synthetase (NDP forming)